jgi:hypothetical protein
LQADHAGDHEAAAFLQNMWTTQMLSAENLRKMGSELLAKKREEIRKTQEFISNPDGKIADQIQHESALKELQQVCFWIFLMSCLFKVFPTNDSILCQDEETLVHYVKCMEEIAAARTSSSSSQDAVFTVERTLNVLILSVTFPGDVGIRQKVFTGDHQLKK